MKTKGRGNRMIIDVPVEVQMAIKLRAVKANCTTGEVVAYVVRYVLLGEVEEAEKVLGINGKGIA